MMRIFSYVLPKERTIVSRSNNNVPTAAFIEKGAGRLQSAPEFARGAFILDTLAFTPSDESAKGVIIHNGNSLQVSLALEKAPLLGRVAHQLRAGHPLPVPPFSL